MRIIEGVVCIAVVDGAEVLFGKNTGEGQGGHQNFCTNDLTPFLNVSEAKNAKAELKNRFGAEAVSLAKLRIDLAETSRESYMLRKRRRLIVVRKMPEFKETVLIGASNKSARSRYPLYGALLGENGFQSFTSFEPAEYAASEEHRQSGCPVFLATFKFKRL